MGYQLGVDIGTSFSAAALARNGRVELASLGTRTLEIPTVVFLEPGGALLVGEAAVRRGTAEPGRMAREFKRRLGDPAPILLAGTPYSPEALMAAVLRTIVDDVAIREGERPDHVTLTHPANWGPYKRELFDHVASLADVTPASTTTEPEAAAINFASTTRVAAGETIAVYDLGGGTFDAAVLRKTAASFERLGSPEGVEHLGGIDFDEAVFGYVRRALGPSFAELDPTDAAVRTAVGRLRQECVEAKEALSTDTETTIPVLLPALQTQIRLTRGEFEDLIRPALASTIEALRRALRSAAVEPADVSTTVLAGGSSRIPLIAELIRAQLGLPVAIGSHPKHAVALGAAQLASRVVAEPVRAVLLPPPGPPPAPLPPTTETLRHSEPTRPDTREPAPDRTRVGTEPAALVDTQPPRRRRVVLAAGAAGLAALLVVAFVAFRPGGGDGDDEETLGTGTSVTTGPATTPALTTADGSTTTPRSTAVASTSASVSTAATAVTGVECAPTSIALLTQTIGPEEHDWVLLAAAAELAVDQFNDANPACTVTLRTFDAAGSVDVAAADAADVVSDDQIVGAVAVYLSNQVEAAGPVLDAGGVPFVVAQGKASSLDDHGWATFNRVVGDEAAPGPAAVTYLRDTLGAQRVFVIDDGQANAGLATAVRDGLGTDTVVGSEAVAPDQQDFAGTVIEVFGAGADAVYFGGGPETAGHLVSALREAEFTGAFMMPESVNDARLTLIAGSDNAEGAFLTCHCAPAGASPAFVSAFSAANGNDPPAYAAEVFDAANILLAGIGTGVDDRAEMVDFVRSFDGEGVSKPIAFGTNGQIEGNPSYVYEVTDGEAVFVAFNPG